jgi:hypothetical protein
MNHFSRFLLTCNSEIDHLRKIIACNVITGAEPKDTVILFIWWNAHITQTLIPLVALFDPCTHPHSRISSHSTIVKTGHALTVQFTQLPMPHDPFMHTVAMLYHDQKATQDIWRTDNFRTWIEVDSQLRRRDGEITSCSSVLHAISNCILNLIFLVPLISSDWNSPTASALQHVQLPSLWDILCTLCRTSRERDGSKTSFKNV